ncbi:MAG: TetR/AcrR family transcriptional regulator [Bacteroidales bacterium]|nr:TetR/AcrR family transcriptional regulator [Bacteroidales bacterium]
MDNTESTSNTEQQILEAAQEVFIEKGKDGARMQEIADRAGINKALLHYYFRSKDKLFLTIFKTIIHKLLKQVDQYMDTDDIFEFIEKVVHSYIAVLSKNHYLPSFILNEINRNHEGILQIIKTSDLDKSKLEKMVEKNIAEGKIIPISLEQLIVDILALCIFPIAAKPIILGYLFQGDKKAHAEFMDQRAEHIIHLMKLALTPQNNFQS